MMNPNVKNGMSIVVNQRNVKMFTVCPKIEEKIGKQAAAYVEIRQWLWEYIADNNLLYGQNKRFIHCDQYLQELFDCNQTDIFKIHQLLRKHYSESRKHQSFSCSCKKIKCKPKKLIDKGNVN